MDGVLTAALIPFFLINLFGKRSKMFMGDSGALMVGFLLGVMAIRFCETDINLKGICAVEAAPGVVFSVLAIPVIDTLRLFASRWMRGKSPFAPDKRHLHHKLLTIYNGVHKKIQSIMAIPEHKPSIPSIRLIALINPTKPTKVNGIPTHGLIS